MSTKAELEEELERLKTEMSSQAVLEDEIVDATEPAITEEVAEPAAEKKPKRATLRLQSKYRNHIVVIRPTRRVFHPALGYTESIPGVYARFEGPQRIFDSQFSAQKNKWDEATLDQVERTLVAQDAWLTDYYPAPLSPLPEHLYEYARILPPSARPKCQAFWYDGPNLLQCSSEATAGRLYCHTHDPDTPRIIHGGGTTK